MEKKKRSDDTIWIDYISALKRLENLVEDQASCLSGGDWENIVSMMGKIENAQIALRHQWQKLQSGQANDDQKSTVHEVDREQKNEATRLIKRIQDKKSANEKLMRAEMASLKKSLAQLRKTRNSHIKYLEQEKQTKAAILEITN